jgi:hypothetical protein
MSAGNTVVSDQAVFTSIRTLTGQGYRIVAASPGVHADERSEITARSPSHGSLGDDRPDALGLLTYELSSGRRCVGYVCHAGTEHTGRGGQRVYTHMALLDRAAYRAFDSDPTRVHTAIGDCVRASGPMLKPPPHIGTMELTPPAPVVPPAPGALNWLGVTAANLIADKRLVLTGEGNPIAFLQLVLLSMPRSLREQVNASTEVRFSPSRGMNLVLLGRPDPQLARQLTGQDIRFAAVNTAPPPVPAHLEAWFQLVDRRYNEGRFAEIAQLTSGLCADAASDSLSRIAAVLQDMETLETGDLAVVENVSQKHRGNGRAPAEQALLEKLRCTAQHRREQLQEPVNVV